MLNLGWIQYHPLLRHLQESPQIPPSICCPSSSLGPHLAVEKLQNMHGHTACAFCIQIHERSCQPMLLWEAELECLRGFAGLSVYFWVIGFRWSTATAPRKCPCKADFAKRLLRTTTLSNQLAGADTDNAPAASTDWPCIKKKQRSHFFEVKYNVFEYLLRG